MLRIVPQASAAGAKSYYSTADYYTQGQELQGIWQGKAALRLGLSGVIEKKDWDALSDNRNPATGKILTARIKENRRVGFDINFHVPKSISILFGLTGDQRILDAFRDSVRETMQDMEAEMKVRVRKDGCNEDRTTGNLVWGEFLHTTARPVDGLPDPHVHIHAFAFNFSYDQKENCWKAGQFGDLKRDAPFFQALYHSRLARKMEEMGLPVVRSKKGWELAGVPKTAIEKFSRRTELIEKTAKELGIIDEARKAELGAQTRERKQKEQGFSELQNTWWSRLTPDEDQAVRSTYARLGSERLPEDLERAQKAAVLAIEHCLERKSVVPERTILAEALKRSVGKATPQSIRDSVDRQHLVIAERDGRRMATTRDVLSEERAMIDFARNGKGTCRPLGDALYAIKRDWLNDGQRRAVKHVLASPDRVIAIRGAAGTGKTSMMHEAIEAIEAKGKQVFVFAPSADASRGVLRDVERFETADTVARLLVDQRLQQQVRNQVVWIDEAGLLGTKTLGQVFGLAEQLHARIILSGDDRQHGSVERGAALRLLQEEAGIYPAEISEIMRQSGDYKRAVQALSLGRTAKGFGELDRLGWIHEVADANRYKLLAHDYVQTVSKGETALIVSPTHRESEIISDEVRSELRQAGKLGTNEHRVTILVNKNLTEAERCDAFNYDPGDILVFHQNAVGFTKGARLVVSDDPLPLSQAARFQVYSPAELPIAQGDLLRITRNGKTADERHALNNGAIYKVLGFDRKGNIILQNGWKVSKDYGFLSHGFCVTSQSSQGRTVDNVFIGVGAESFPAASREGFYVACSRGRRSAHIYCSDKESLLDAVMRSDERLSATELVSGRVRQLEHERIYERLPEHIRQQEREEVVYDR